MDYFTFKKNLTEAAIKENQYMPKGVTSQSASEHHQDHVEDHKEMAKKHRKIGGQKHEAAAKQHDKAADLHQDASDHHYEISMHRGTQDAAHRQNKKDAMNNSRAAATASKTAYSTSHTFGVK